MGKHVTLLLIIISSFFQAAQAGPLAKKARKFFDETEDRMDDVQEIVDDVQQGWDVTQSIAKDVFDADLRAKLLPEGFIKNWTKSSKWGQKITKSGRKILDVVPGGSIFQSIFGGGDQLDRIEGQQKFSISGLKAISKRFRRTAGEVHDLYHCQEVAQWRGQELAHSLKTGGSFQNTATVPYAHFQAQRPLERTAEGCLAGSRAAVAAQGPAQKDFVQDYEKAVAYEKALQKELRTQQRETLTLHQKNAAQLRGEIAVLSKMKQKKGLTLSEVTQLEMTLDHKKKHLQGLREKIATGIEAALVLTPEQQATLCAQQGAQNDQNWKKFLSEAEKRMHQKYGHLWRFW